jgi:hypothetical protein
MNSSRKVGLTKPKLFSLFSALILISTLLAPLPGTVYAVAAPTPLSPADGTETTIANYPPVGVPTVVWGGVTDATLYKLQFSSDIGFSTIALEINTPLTSFTPLSMSTSLFADGDWYWRVRVEKPDVGPFSTPMHFYKLWASNDPFNGPVLVSPSYDQMIDFYSSPIFTWERVMGASQYKFQIAASPDGFGTPLYSQTTLSNSHQPAEKLANGQYYWRVIPMDAASHLGKESEIGAFQLLYGTNTLGEVPELYTPSNFSQVQFTPTFHWKAIPGAEKYQLEFMTDDGVCEYGSGTTIETRNTTYTPVATFSNDNYCWHVRVISGDSNGEWSDTWHFRKQWDIQPELLTPTNNYQFGIYPLYTWAPVPGASYYKIEIAIDQQWSDPFDSRNTGNPWYTPRKYYGTIPYPYAWRVTPYDWNNHAGGTSVVDSFQSYYTSTAPSPVYPLYYYLPNDPNVFGDVVLNPYEDNTAPYPVFIWQRPNNPYPWGGTYAPAYRIQVSTSSTFSNIVWTADTESTHAAPTESNPFPGIDPEQNYYWRVCPLDGIGGSCKTVPDKGDQWWSQIWRARFNPDFALPPTNGNAPVLLRPEYGDEWVEATPLFEWRAFEGADFYEIRINRDPSFPDGTNITGQVPYPAFSAQTSIAQRFLGRLDYGTFYWQVRANSSGTWSDWSETRRFQIASQSEWRYSRLIGDIKNRLQIGADEAGDADPSYDLTTLYASNSNENWYFGFDVSLSSGVTNTYGLFIDIDHIDGSGAAVNPAGRQYNVSTIPAHEPEFAVYVDQKDGVVDDQNTWIFTFENNQWDDGQKLSDLAAGDLYSNGGYLELQIPASAIGMSDYTGSISTMLFSTENEVITDTVPSDLGAHETGLLSRFTSVSEHMNLLYPFNTDGGNDPTAYPTVGPFIWDFPTGTDPTGLDPNPPSPWAGSTLNACLDAACSTVVDTIELEAKPHYFASANQTLLDDVSGDTTYYWRVQPRYLHNDLEYYGSYNSGYSFMREGFVPQNLQTSVTFATPTFSWDLVEGAGAYDFQVSKGPDFGNTDLIINLTGITQNTYTPVIALQEREYWWRVRARRYGSFTSDWSSVGNFVLALPTVTGLTPNDPDGLNVAEYAPTFCWDHLIAYDAGIPVMTAWKYKVEVSKDPGFSAIFDSITTEQNCWTPIKGYDDGTYYWHVAMIDGNAHLAPYGAAAEFTKQYPVTTLISPVGSIDTTPTFVWTPVDGAKNYSLQVSKDPGFTPLFENIETINTQYTPTKLYEINRIYYWRVAIHDDDGKYGPYNDAMIIVGDVFLSKLPLVSK